MIKVICMMVGRIGISLCVGAFLLFHCSPTVKKPKHKGLSLRISLETVKERSSLLLKIDKRDNQYILMLKEWNEKIELSDSALLRREMDCYCGGLFLPIEKKQIYLTLNPVQAKEYIKAIQNIIQRDSLKRKTFCASDIDSHYSDFDGSVLLSVNLDSQREFNLKRTHNLGKLKCGFLLSGHLLGTSNRNSSHMWKKIFQLTQAYLKRVGKKGELNKFILLGYSPYGEHVGSIYDRFLHSLITISPL